MLVELSVVTHQMAGHVDTNRKGQRKYFVWQDQTFRFLISLYLKLEKNKIP
jgi:hypothetical protein